MKTDDVMAAFEIGETKIATAMVFEAVGYPRGCALSLAELTEWSFAVSIMATENRLFKLAVLAQRLEEPASVDALYEVGYELLEVGSPLLAATYLWHCQNLTNACETSVMEFVCALEDAKLFEEAYQFLLARPELRRMSFGCLTLFGFNAAKTGRAEEAYVVLDELWRWHRATPTVTSRQMQGFMHSIHGALREAA